MHPMEDITLESKLGFNTMYARCDQNAASILSIASIRNIEVCRSAKLSLKYKQDVLLLLSYTLDACNDWHFRFNKPKDCISMSCACGLSLTVRHAL